MTVWTVAQGVFLGHLTLIALALAIYYVGGWLYRRWPGGRSGRSTLVVAVLLAAVAFGLGAFAVTKLASWFGTDEATIPVATDPATMEKARVKTNPGLVDRIQMGQVKPTQVRIGTAPSEAGQKRVADYCTPVAVGQLVQTSAKPGLPTGISPVVIPQQVSRRLLPDFNGKVKGRKVFIASTLNDGTPWDAGFKVHGRWTFASSGDSVLVTSERFWSRIVRGLARCGMIAGVGAGAGAGLDLLSGSDPLRGAARGAAIAGGTCAALEIAF